MALKVCLSEVTALCYRVLWEVMVSVCLLFVGQLMNGGWAGVIICQRHYWVGELCFHFVLPFWRSGVEGFLTGHTEGRKSFKFFFVCLWSVFLSSDSKVGQVNGRGRGL